MLKRDMSLVDLKKMTNLYDLDLLKNLVEIPSLTSNYSGVLKVQNIIAAKLEALGLSTEFVQNEKDCSAPLLRGFLKGTSLKTVTLIFHADTVAKEEWGHQLSYETLSHKLKGPGVADNKGGVVMALSALEVFLKEYKNELSIQVISSPNEETGSQGFHHLFRQWGNDSKYLLGFEPALKDGGVITSRGGNKWYSMRIQGLEAHSGRKDPHVNAAHEFAIKINKLHKINNIKKGIRLNVGSIRSERDTFNTVCGELSAKLDLRFIDDKQANKYSQKVEKILSKSFLKCPFSGSQNQTVYSIADFCPPMSSNKKNTKLKKMFLPKEDRHLPYHSGGAADINYFSHAKAFCLDGLGPMGGGMHTQQEFIYVNKLDERLTRIVELFEKINRRA